MAVRGINKVILVGRLGKDPEVRYIPNGGAVANLQVATSETWRDKQTGEMKEQTEWHRVVLFGKLAEVAGEYLRKGAQVYIEGQLRTRSWEDNGITRYVTEILVKTTGTMQMLGHMKVPKPRVESELKLPPTLQLSFSNTGSFNPLHRARGRTGTCTKARSFIHGTTAGTPHYIYIFFNAGGGYY